MRILGIYDSFIKKTHFERGLERLKRKNEIRLTELDESKRWDAEDEPRKKCKLYGEYIMYV